jgi:hypothetical protein
MRATELRVDLTLCARKTTRRRELRVDFVRTQNNTKKRNNKNPFPYSGKHTINILHFISKRKKRSTRCDAYFRGSAECCATWN